jgi:hypothetical protein
MISKIKIYTTTGRVISLSQAPKGEVIVKGTEAELKAHAAEVDAAKAILKGAKK